MESISSARACVCVDIFSGHEDAQLSSSDLFNTWPYVWAASSKVRKTSEHGASFSHVISLLRWWIWWDLLQSLPFSLCLPQVLLFIQHPLHPAAWPLPPCFSHLSPHSPWTSLASSVRQESLFSLPCHSHFGQYATQLYYWPGLDSCQPISGLKARPNHPDADDYGGGRGRRTCPGNSLTGRESLCVNISVSLLFDR